MSSARMEMQVQNVSLEWWEEDSFAEEQCFVCGSPTRGRACINHSLEDRPAHMLCAMNHVTELGLRPVADFARNFKTQLASPSHRRAGAHLPAKKGPQG